MSGSGLPARPRSFHGSALSLPAEGLCAADKYSRGAGRRGMVQDFWEPQMLLFLEVCPKVSCYTLFLAACAPTPESCAASLSCLSRLLPLHWLQGPRCSRFLN
ncbi:uncharacterized protein [Physeter macrocephalus]|uniref:Uncharacterized protein isoform X2 n=1 Tax=Physeter macrocephalus TaxID=9755 RepID=A0A455C7Q3_PHYMC|nr:uncharacterized protein LOC114488044 isoform X2 [Physeter catodon]|eukprot:XP_028357375.1 uncharacterized protein LOC114488044 isoform X2 [Physeter catodon]